MLGYFLLIVLQLRKTKNILKNVINSIKNKNAKIRKNKEK